MANPFEMQKQDLIRIVDYSKEQLTKLNNDQFIALAKRISNEANWLDSEAESYFEHRVMNLRLLEVQQRNNNSNRR